MANTAESREFAVSSKITSMPCALPLSSTTDLMQFIALICEGRRLSTNVNQALAFALSAFMSLFLLSCSPSSSTPLRCSPATSCCG